MNQQKKFKLLEFYFRVTQSKFLVWNGAVVDNTLPQFVKMEKFDCTNQEKVHRHFWKVAKLSPKKAPESPGS